MLARSSGAAELVLAGLEEELLAQRVSSLHLLFNDGAEDVWLRSKGWLQRRGCQFHWHNRGYQCLDEFLAA